MGANQSDIEFKHQIINGEKDIYFFKSNSKYIVEKYHHFSNIINLYTMENENETFNIKYDNTIKNKTTVNDIELHPKYSRLLLSSLNNGEIYLWEIPESKDSEFKNKSTINAHDSFVICSSFNPELDNIFLSYSENEIKIWDLNKFTYQNNYSYQNAQNIVKWENVNKFGYYKDKNIYMNDYNNEKNSQIFKINESIKDYYFIQNELITANNECVKLWDIRKSEPISILNINQIIQKYIYDSNLNYLYLINPNNLQIVDLNEFKLIDNIYNDIILNPI